MASLYVGDLHRDVTESVLLEKFSSVGRVSSLHLCRNKRTGASLQYAFINFQQRADAERALELLNYNILLGQPMRIMWHQKDSSLRKSNVGNIVISHLEKSIDSLALYDVFSTFGNVLSCKVVCDENGSRGYGYVHFERPEDAEAAIKRLDGMLFNEQKVHITHFKSCKERQAEQKKTVKDVSSKQEHESPVQKIKESPKPQQNTENCVNLCIKNLDPLVDDERLCKEFAPFGTIVHAKVIRSGGHSRAFGFICYSSPGEATRAMRNMQGRTLIRKPLHINLIQLKEKTQEGAVRHHQPAPSTGVMDAVPQAENLTANNTRVQRVEPHSSPHRATQDVQLQRVQDYLAIPAKEKAAPPEVPTGDLAAVKPEPTAVKAASAAITKAPAADEKAVTSAVPAVGKIIVPAAVPAACENAVQTAVAGEKAVPAASETAVPAAVPAAGETAVPAAVPAADEKSVPAAVLREKLPTKKSAALHQDTKPSPDTAAGETAVSAAVPAAGETAVPAAVPAAGEPAVPAAVPAAGEPAVPAAVPAAGEKSVPAAVSAADEKSVPAAVSAADEKSVPAAVLREKLPTKKSAALHQDTKPSLDTQNAVPAPSQRPLTFYMLESADVDEQIRMLNEHIFPLVEKIHPIRAKDLTNMIIQGQNNEDLLNMIGDPKLLRIEVEQIAAVLRAREAGQDVRLPSPKNRNKRRRKKRHMQ